MRQIKSKTQNTEIQKETQPAYMVLCDFELVPARTLEDAINMADSYFDCVEIYKRNGTTGPAFYKYLCNVEKQNHPVIPGKIYEQGTGNIDTNLKTDLSQATTIIKQKLL